MTSILTVDDSASIRQAIKIALGAEGYQVTGAANGADGLTKASAGGYDLIITDLNMPVMDGLSMIRALRAKPNGAGVPILFLSTENDAEVKAHARAAGATGWLTKPFTPDQLVRVVKKVLAS